MKQLLIKHKAIILYVLFGGLTTLTNILSYLLLAHALNFGVMPSTVLAFVISSSKYSYFSVFGANIKNMLRPSILAADSIVEISAVSLAKRSNTSLPIPL